MDDLNKICFQMISNIGEAKSKYMETINYARQYEYEQAHLSIDEGTKCLIVAQKIHLQLIQQEAQHNNLPINLLLLHTEDQMMSTETFKIMALEWIKCYQHIENLEKKLGRQVREEA